VHKACPALPQSPHAHESVSLHVRSRSRHLLRMVAVNGRKATNSRQPSSAPQQANHATTRKPAMGGMFRDRINAKAAIPYCHIHTRILLRDKPYGATSFACWAARQLEPEIQESRKDQSPPYCRPSKCRVLSRYLLRPSETYLASDQPYSAPSNDHLCMRTCHMISVCRTVSV